MGTAITKVTKQSSPKKHHCSLGYRLPIRLQARVLGYSQRPSVTKDRLWLQVPDLVLKLYHSFPLFPSPFAIMDTMIAKGDFLLLPKYASNRVFSQFFCHSLAIRSQMRMVFYFLPLSHAKFLPGASTNR